MLFDVCASMQKPLCALVGRLFLFKRLSIILVPCANPLAWWQIHEIQLEDVSFFVKKILGILGLQIELECVLNFNPTIILIALKCCKLRWSLNCIIIVVKN